MKKRRNVIISLLLVAALALGIGYAAVTDVLDITGSADVSAAQVEETFNLNVHFKEGGAVANDAGNTASVNADNNDKASFSTNTLKAAGDKATFTFTIVNESDDVSANIIPRISSNTNEAYFGISSDWAGAEKTLGPDSEITYTVTVELLQDPVDAVSGSFIIELTATSAIATADPQA